MENQPQQQQQINLANLDIVQLKALGYDLLVQNQQIQNNLILVNNELTRRAQLQQEQARGFNNALPAEGPVASSATPVSLNPPSVNQ